jgi:hypothetical protein
MMNNIQAEIDDWKEKEKRIPFHFLTEADIENMIVGALEGGSNYWYFLPDLKPIAPYMKPHEPLATEITRILLEHRELKLVVTEVESMAYEDEVDLDADEPAASEILGYISAAKMEQAEMLMLKHPNIRRHLGDVLSGNDDASTADVYFQMVVMGDVVYG